MLRKGKNTQQSFSSNFPLYAKLDIMLQVLTVLFYNNKKIHLYFINYKSNSVQETCPCIPVNLAFDPELITMNINRSFFVTFGYL